jgi:RecA/RadA recombinase
MLRYIPEDWEIWLAMDADPAGDRACEQFFHQLGPERIARLQLPAKDLNQWLQDNPDLTSKDVEDTLVGLNYQTMKSKKNSWLTIDPTAEDDEEDNLVTDTPFPVLNDLLAGGFKARQTTGILAPSGRGKTTLVNQLGIYAASQGCTVGLISVEGDRPTLNKKLKETIRGTVPQKDWGKVPRKLLVSDLDGSRVTWRDCLAEFRAMVDTGARLLILDNLDHITGQNNAEKTFAYAEIIEFCKETATHCLVVWQPNKVDRNQIVNSGNQKGHSQMLQDADNYLNLNRVKDFNVIEAEKVREEGIEGDGKVWLVYNKGRRAFDPTTEAPATNLGNSLSVIPLKAYSPVS